MTPFVEVLRGRHSRIRITRRVRRRRWDIGSCIREVSRALPGISRRLEYWEVSKGDVGVCVAGAAELRA